MVAETRSWDMFQKNEATKNKLDLGKSQDIKESDESESQPERSWGSFKNTSTYQGKPDPTADESTFDYLIRNVTANVARGAEGYLGRYGDIQKFSENAIAKNRKAIKSGSFGLLGTVLAELIPENKWEQIIKGEGPLKINLPTSEDIRKQITEPISGNYLKPKTKAEKIVQGFSSDVGSIGRSGGANLNRRLINQVGIPAAANAAKATVDELGFGEKTAGWIKMGVWTALGLLNNVNGPAYAANLMNEGREGFGPNVTANINRYEHGINRVANNMLQGDPRSQLAQQQIAGIRNDIASGQTSMCHLMNRYDAINSAKRDRGLFQLHRRDRRAAIRNINQVRDAVRSEIERLGRIHNPQALEAWRNGVQAFSTIHRTTGMTNWIRNTLNDPYSKSAVATLFGSGAVKAPALLGGTGVAVPALYKAGQVAVRVWGDQNLAHYYWNAIRAAAEENAGAFTKNFNALEAGYQKKYGKSTVAKSSKKKKDQNTN